MVPMMAWHSRWHTGYISKNIDFGAQVIRPTCVY